MNEKKEESESGLQSHEQEGWRFISVKLDMLNTKQLDQISDVLPLQRLPDILYGGNRFYMVQEARDVMYEDAAEVPSRYVAIVLGARVMKDGTPSHALEDRLHAALDLWRARKIERILVTGDHGEQGYNEVASMHRWLTQRGVPPERIFTDHAGFRTFDSMVRAAEIFEVKEAVVCTQRFHLARSIYLARQHGIDAVGLVADRRVYAKRRKDARREFLARVVAFLDVQVWGREPKFLGPKIPIQGRPEASYDAALKAFVKTYERDRS